MGLPSLLQSGPNYSLTFIKWSLTIAAVSRNHLQESLQSYLGHIRNATIFLLFLFNGVSHEKVEGSDTTSTVTSSLYVLHGVDSPLKSFHIHGTLHKASLINKRQVSSALYSVTVVPKEHCLGIPKSLIDFVGKLLLSAS